MKTIVQLLIAALVLNASAQAGQAAWRYYQFRDAVEQEARFGSGESTSELHRRVLALAEEHGIAIAAGDVTVQRRGDQTFVWASYVEPVPLVPSFYTREQLFEFEVSVRPVRPLTVDDLK